MEVCPLAKTGKELLLDLVNAENDSAVAEEQLIFGEVQEGGEEGNSAVTLTAAPDSPWNSFVDVKFDRLDLGTLMGGQSIEVSVPKGATKEDIVCHLNYTYGMKFDSREFDLLPQEDGELPELFILKALPGNLAYTGQFDLKVDLERMPLAARLLVTDLDGFKYIWEPTVLPPTYHYQSAEPPIPGLGVVGSYGDTGKLIDYVDNGQVLAFTRGMSHSRTSGGVISDVPGRVLSTIVFNGTNGQPQHMAWRVVAGINVDISTLGANDLLDFYDVRLVARSRARSSLAWTTDTRVLTKTVSQSGAISYSLKALTGTASTSLSLRKFGERNFIDHRTLPNGNQTSAANARSDAPSLMKGLDVRQIGTGSNGIHNFAYIGEVEYEWQVTRKDGLIPPFTMVTKFTMP